MLQYVPGTKQYLATRVCLGPQQGFDIIGR